MKKANLKRSLLILLSSILLTLIIGFGSSISVFAADLPSGLPEEQLEQKIDEYINENKDTIAAFSIAVFTKDDVLIKKSYGFANISENVPNDTDTVFEWGSITKMITWVSVMQLVEQGKLDLDADIRTYLPESFLKKLKYDDKITMLNLMNHNAGWQEMVREIDVPDGSNLRKLEEALKRDEPTQVFRPGEVVAYSNWGVGLAGYIVERVSGKPFYQYAKENILSPLGMNNTAIKADWSDNQWVREQRKKLHGYDWELNDLGIVDKNTTCYPAGAAFGTIADLSKFGQALLPDENGASPLFESPDTLKQMCSPSLYYPDGKTAENCHGFWTYNFENVIGHGGNSEKCSSGLVIDPVSGIGIATMTNNAATDAHINKMCSMIFIDKYNNASGKPISTDDLERLKGYYSWSRGTKTGVAKVEDFLATILFPNDKHEIEVLEPGVYKVTSPDGSYDILFAQFDENGQVQKLSSSTMELLRINGFYYAFQSVIVNILFIGSILYSVVMLIIWIIRAIRKKKYSFDKMQFAVYGAVILAALTAAQWKFMESNEYIYYIIRGVLFLISALVPIAYTALLALKWKTLEKNKWQKVWLVVTGIMGLIVTFNVFFWQLWMFWAY